MPGHLRGEDEDIALDCPLASSAAFAGGAGKSSEKELLLTTIIRYGYIWDGNSIDDDERVMGSNNEIVATMIQEEFVHLVNAFLVGEEVNKTDTTTKTTASAMDEPTPTSSSCTISALTYSTAAKLRQPSLMQDEEIIAATSELLSFNYRLSMPFVRSMGESIVLYALCLFLCPFRSIWIIYHHLIYANIYYIFTIASKISPCIISHLVQT